jgi:hypothetical protein
VCRSLGLGRWAALEMAKINSSNKSLLPETHIGNVMGRIADDYLVSIAMTKSSIYDSLTLPFMHSHALELAAKSAALRTMPFEEVVNYGHNIKRLLSTLATGHSSIEKSLPSDQAFRRYGSVFPRTDNTPGVNIYLPSDDVLMEYELCFFIEGVADLKCGFGKNRDQVGGVHLAYDYLNPCFVDLYRACRNIFRTAAHDMILASRMNSVQLNERCAHDLQSLLS